MAKKPLSFLEQATALEEENLRLVEAISVYEKAFDMMLKQEFNTDAKSIHKALSGSSGRSKFEERIDTFFNLVSNEDKEDFLSIMLSDSSLNYFVNKRFKDE